MTTIQRNAAALALMACIVALAACATPASAPSASPTPTPTVEPTAEPPSEPQSALPLQCQQVIATATVVPSFVTPVELRFDETSTPTSVGGAAFVQGGGLDCVWGGHESGTGYHEGLNFNIVAASAAEFDAGKWVPDGAVFDTLGDRSVLHCILQAAGGYTCSADILVGDYWINAFVGDTGDGFTIDGGLSTATELLSHVVGSVNAAGTPRALWSPPADSFDGAALCSDPSAAAAALGEDPAALTVVLDPWPSTNAAAVARSRAAGVTCQWSSATTSLTIDVLQGGSWWTDGLAASPPADAPHYRGPVPIDVPGVDAAYLSGNDGGSVIILFTRGSVIGFDLREYDPALATAAAIAFAATLGG